MPKNTMRKTVRTRARKKLSMSVGVSAMPAALVLKGAQASSALPLATQPPVENIRQYAKISHNIRQISLNFSQSFAPMRPEAGTIPCQSIQLCQLILG